MNRSKLILWCVMILSCIPQQDICAQTAGTLVQYETECLGVEGDGSQTLRAWGFGKNKKDALEQARKNAVYDVIFKGIKAGVAGCNMRPLINEVNARERHEDYFDRFFMDGGEYKKYVSDADEKRSSKDKAKGKLGVRYGVTVRVLRSELRAKLKADHLIQ